MGQTINLTETQMKQKHPLEYVLEHTRSQENPYNRMNEISLMFTNFPENHNINQEYLKNLCAQVDKNAVIKKIVIQGSMRGDSETSSMPRTAYAIVEFELNRWVATVRRGLRKHWNGDKLLKVKTLKDLKNENFKERTVVVSGIQSHTNVNDLVNVFNNFGAVTSIELPSIDAVVKAQLEEKGLISDHFTKVSQKKKDEQYRFA